MCELYRHFDKDGQLLYVGISLSTSTRLSQHKRDSRWSHLIDSIKIERFESRDAALNAEKIAIKDENPIYNIQHNNNGLRHPPDLDYNSTLIEEQGNLLLFSFGGHSGFIFVDLDFFPGDLFWDIDSYGNPYECQFLMIEKTIGNFSICYKQDERGMVSVGDMEVLGKIDNDIASKGLSKWFKIDWDKLHNISKNDDGIEHTINDISIPLYDHEVLHRLHKNKSWTNYE